MRSAGWPQGLKVVVSALNGFPPLSGVEVWQLAAKAAAAGMHLLDRKDDRLVVACGAKGFRQSPRGEVLYPGPEAFTSAGLTLSAVGTTITPAEPALEDLVDGGLFKSVCTAPAGSGITATFNVQQAQDYSVLIYWAETACVPKLRAAARRLHCAACLCRVGCSVTLPWAEAASTAPCAVLRMSSRACAALCL